MLLGMMKMIIPIVLGVEMDWITLSPNYHRPMLPEQ